MVPAAPVDGCRSSEPERGAGVSRRDGDCPAAGALADGSVGRRTAGGPPTRPPAQDGGAARAGTRDGRRGDTRARDAVLPFSTMLFAHVPAALLAFLSFALLFGRDAGPWRIAAAGVAAGLAVSTDAPLSAPAVLLGLYAASRTPHLRRLAAFAAGGLVGLLPLLGYDWWAFGIAVPPRLLGRSAQPRRRWDRAGAGRQRLLRAQRCRISTSRSNLLLSQRGLLVLTPVVGAASGRDRAAVAARPPFRGSADRGAVHRARCRGTPAAAASTWRSAAGCRGRAS